MLEVVQIPWNILRIDLTLVMFKYNMLKALYVPGIV